ncbi:MAG: hypothetical protein JXQ68_00105 [Campylobacterales bacterium]|nr:hypothetical protein [Campylobacterales bacterium]
MKKILLSTVAIAVATTMASASSSNELATLKAQMAEMSKKISELESKQATINTDNGVLIKSKAPVIEFSGTHYLGFVSSKEDGGDRTDKFETRRNYFQAKAFFKENPKDYVRITLDTFQNTGETSGKDDNSWEVRLKYAYLYLDSILPYTGVEIGQAHRPWIDYEEHGGWNYRSISKVFVEDGNAAHFTNSSDIGINFKTKTPYFSSELGVYNGEGYHGEIDGEGISAEWRLTGHLLGTGTEKRKDKVTYADLSFFGQMNQNNLKMGDATSGDFQWYGVHAVYNQPQFLLAAQYVKTNEAGTSYAGDGYSVNGEFRFAQDWAVIGRYDSFDLDNGTEKERKLGGVAWKYNDNVRFIANYLQDTEDDVDTDNVMLTAEVHW